MSRFPLLLMTGLVTGCTGNQLYQAIGSPDPVGPPVRYPLDYPICNFGSDGGMIYAPLRVRIVHSTWFPDPDRLLAARGKGVTHNGCNVPKSGSGPSMPRLTDKDSQNAGNAAAWRGLDKTGKGYFTSTSYRWELLNEIDKKKEQEELLRAGQYDEDNRVKFGYYYPDVIEKEEALTINGRSWEHWIKKRYKTTSGSLPERGQLLAWYEFYELRIDSGHVLRKIGRYDATVVGDAAWLGARRQLLRKLVEGTHVYPVTQSEIDEARLRKKQGSE